MKKAAPRVEGLAVVEKYDSVFRYLYNITRTMPRRHGVFRDELLQCMLRIPRLLYVAAKSNQISRVREADAELAALRWHLRMAEAWPLQVITSGQHGTVSVLLAEVGSMLGDWIARLSGGRHG
ncbi:diversity-generating retroelement protein Avd [Marinobacter sp.]|uniref:diversity-generating retroelement protein Avd n=1 Tax=Marinobacter sp. TaxID=50741 RepID=UPI0034A49C71